MDAIATLGLISPPAYIPVTAAITSGVAQTVPQNAATVIPIAPNVEDQLAQAEQQRYDAAQKASEAVVNSAPSGYSHFTIYKDPSSGQYITRYTSRDGKITYEPQPQLLAPHTIPPSITLEA